MTFFGIRFSFVFCLRFRVNARVFFVLIFLPFSIFVIPSFRLFFVLGAICPFSPRVLYFYPVDEIFVKWRGGIFALLFLAFSLLAFFYHGIERSVGVRSG